MKKVFVFYATRFGQTQKIVDHICADLRQQGVNCHTVNMLTDDLPNPGKDDFLVFGLPVFYGKHLERAVSMLNALVRPALMQNTAIFSVNLTARKQDKCSATNNPYFRKLLKELSFLPKVTGVFAGQLNYPAYNWLDRCMIRLIMKLTHGNADGKSCEEFTNWQDVDLFSQKIVKEIL